MFAKYICFDTETTGLDPIKNNLLTVCFVILDDKLQELTRFSYNIKHDEYTLSTKAMTVNKINLIEHEKNALTIKEANKNLITRLKKLNAEYRLVPIAHNISFDISFIKNSGLLPENEYSKYISYNGLDTIVLCQFSKLTGVLPSDLSISLMSLCKHFDIDYTGELHTCETDILITIEILKRIGNFQIASNSKKRKIC